MSSNREYQKTHPWLHFNYDLKDLSRPAWMQLGEIISKSMHIARAPIAPKRADDFYKMFLAKGAAATTAIEGNTLSEDQVKDQIDGNLSLPPSQEYLQREVQNILDASNALVNDTKRNGPHPITPEFIGALNYQALQGLTLEPEVVPGQIRKHSVTVARYRGAPAEDCPYLMERMCETIEEFLADTDNRMRNGIFAALFAHIYIALIHPYGDGNGRTSRLLEVYILLRSGFPMPTCQLLSNHYNKTRSEYYRQLDGVSKSGGNLCRFTEYALQGFVDGLQEQVALIQAEQVRVTWINYIHTMFVDEASPTAKRRRHLAIGISRSTKGWTIDEVFASDIKLSRSYAALDQKTLTRDLNFLINMGLILKAGKLLKPNLSEIQSFLPWRHDAEQYDKENF